MRWAQDQQSYSAGPTHPGYQQASTTAAGLATFRVGPGAVGPYRPESSNPDYHTEHQRWPMLQSADWNRHKDYPENIVWVRDAAGNGRGGGGVDYGNVNDRQEELILTSRRLMSLLTPFEKQSPAEESHPQQVTARHTEGQSSDTEVYDHGTVIIHHRKPKVRLPQAWTNEQLKTPPQEHRKDYPMLTPESKPDKGKGKAAGGSGHNDDEGHLSARRQLPWMSTASSRSQGSVISTPRLQTMTPSPPLSVHSPDTPAHLPSFVSEEWLNMVNNVLQRLMRMKRLTSYDVVLALRGKPRTDALFFQRNPQVPGDEHERQSFLRHLRRALRGSPNNLIDFKLRRESPHPMSAIRRQKEREREQAILEEEAEGNNDEVKSPIPPLRMALSLNPTAAAFTFELTGTTRPKDPANLDDKASDSDPFVDDAPTKGGSKRRRGHTKRNSQEQLEKVTADLTGLRTKVSPADFPGQSRQRSPNKADEYDEYAGGIPLPTTIPANMASKNKRPHYRRRYYNSKSGDTSGIAGTKARKPQPSTGQAVEPSGGKGGQEIAKKPSGRKENQARKDKQGKATEQDASIPKIVLPETEWPTLGSAKARNQEHRPASAIWASDPSSLANRRMAAPRPAPSSSSQIPSQSSPNIRPTSGVPTRQADGHKDRDQQDQQNQQNKGAKKG
ncbi:hypothetical protein F5B19DRAFT_452120 [Rostrohypoxylon terebratum]|nr:hypothetical protein F5B19DRAFT_452120 [Rostrohypoxylon terebratum]